MFFQVLSLHAFPVIVHAVLVPITYLAASNSSGAVCLDGSVPAYHLLPGASNSWHISLEGGGWCDSVVSCANRAKGHWGSSIYMQSPTGFAGSLSNDASVNPDFFNWTQVFVRYCDGASFTADVEEPLVSSSGQVLYFRGKRILRAVIDDLRSKGLSNATQVLLSGCSAGGLSTILHCNDVQSLLDPGVTLKCLSDAGFFINTSDPGGHYLMSKLYKDVVSLHKLENTLDQSCIGDSNGDATKCFFPEIMKAYVKPPLFLLNAAYDSWQLEHGLNLSRDSYNSCISYSSCPPVELLQGFRASMLDALSGGWSSLALYINACFTHCQATWDATWNIPKINDKASLPCRVTRSPRVWSLLMRSASWFLQSPAQSVGDWYFERTAQPEQAIDCAYPCNPTCIQQA
ncbi:pectin acetylesterase 3 isoform X2 [Selaginella moellendorffii]|uniref:pectin acetylesterase 3 isoform X2 n=1 Tax=Selaginella moellendorffii TaxID=88036 RepID=UPI000D1CD04A|nr:pectin acetylesterase 3 isoform X2 [Selaginella moellendorffii]|eukprot:XP_024525154.1 pectin acetylesterase 3 isoform X2 [Selaginella moellendorffii]